jgi:hypothetical protein
MRYLGLCAPLLLAACAPTTVIVAGKTVPRLDIDYIGQPFVVRVSAAHPEPGSPSGGLRGFGGRVSGNVCGLEVTYDVQHEGDKTRLTGFVDDGTFESTLEVKDSGVSRLITGHLTERGGGGVSLDLRKNHLFGNVGGRVFALARKDNQYVGSVKINQSVQAAATINGADELWTLPPAAQAAVLPNLLTCAGDELEGALRGSLIVGFGGRQTWEGKHVSAIYHTVTNDQMRAIMNGTRSGVQGGGAALQ